MNKKYLLFIVLAFLSINSIFATSISWTGGGAAGVWEDMDNWNQPRVPNSADDVTIDGLFNVTVSSTSTIESIDLLGGATLTIAVGHTLTLHDPSGSEGINIDGTGSALTVHGAIVVSGSQPSNAIDVNEETSLTVSGTGSITVNSVGEDGIELSGDLTNAGTISITNHTLRGIYAKDGGPGRTIDNSGIITISGGETGIDQQNNFLFTNNGTVIISNASKKLIDDGSNFTNENIFKGDGLVENGDGNDVLFSSGSTVAPGTSTGTLTFDESLDISGVTLEIEIEGANDYDKIIVNNGIATIGELEITGAILSLSGSYVPVGGEEFMILEKTSAGAIDGTFSGIPEGTVIMFNGGSFTITYQGGDGNDMAMINVAPLPVELIDFSARAMEKDVKLAWTTASEENNDYFTVERSTDGRTFEVVAMVEGRGTTTDISKYTFMDESPENGLNYYRLKQTDFDGQFAYSDIKTVELKIDQTIKVYPTVVADVIIIEPGSDLNNELILSVRDLAGREFESLIIPAKSERTEFSLNNLSAGSYFLSIYNEGFVETFKFIKL